MDATGQNRRIYLLGAFRLDSTRKVLHHQGDVISLGPKVIDTLTALVENAGDVVDKQTLFRQIWPDTAVAESSLTKNICLLRKILDEGRQEGSAIQTVARRGYRFVDPVQPEAASTRHTAWVHGAAPGFGAWVRLAVIVGAAAILFAVAAFVMSRSSSEPGLTEADRQYLVGRYVWDKMERSEVRKALSRFENAAKLNSRSPLAHAGIADTYVVMSMLGVGTSGHNLAVARSAAERAVQLDRRLALPHVSLGFVRLLGDFDAAGAEREFRAALALEADSAAAHFGYGILLAHSGRLDEARVSLDRACALDPVSLVLGVERGRTEFYDRHYERAIQLFRELLDREPSSSQAHYYMAMSLRQLGKTEEALQHLRQARLHPNVVAEDEAWIHAMNDGGAASRRLLAERLRMVQENGADPAILAVPAADTGDIDVAMAALEQMWQVRRIELLQLKVSPRWDLLRQDHRFAALVRKVWHK